MRRLAAATITTVLAVCLLAPPAAAYPRPGKTLRVNPLLDLTGGPASGGTPQLSGDGRHVLFPTTARLVEDDTGLAVDCYVRDLVTWSLVRASVAHDGTEANGSCSSPAISRDGRYVAWHSTATNLVPGDTNGLADIFVRDLVAGTTTRASVSAQGAQADGASTSAAISDDGRVVAFLSSATNLVAGDSNAFNDVFVRNMEDGSIQIATLSTEGTQGVTAVSQFELSGNGRHVVFVHRMPWEGDKSSYDDVFVHDLVTRRTELVSVATDGTQPNGNSFYPSISDDGRYVAFGTFGTNLVPNDFNGAADAFVHDRQSGVTERVSVTSHGVEANHVVGVPKISGNGRYVTGNHLPTNYGYQDDNANTDVYVFDRETGAIELASGTPEGTRTGNGISLSPSISDDGRRVAFFSQATDLLGDGENGSHAYVRDMGAPLGIGSLAGEDEGDEVAVSGWVRFAGARMFSTGDSNNDGARAVGAELTRAGATYRPEEEDVFVRIELAPRTHAWAPLVGTTARKPGALTYGVELAIGGVTHEIRATQTAAPTGTTFGLYRCAPTCTKVQDLVGGDGTVGDVVLISVPVEHLGGPGASVGFRRAWAAAGEANTGQLRILDEIGLSSASIPVGSVSVGTSSPGASAGEVAFVPADVSGGRFGQRLPRGSGPREIWAKACLGEACSISNIALG